MDVVYDVIIIGAGPAGLAASIYTARSRLKTALFEGTNPGGQLNSIVTLENYPGFPKGISGPELTEKFMSQSSGFGAQMIYQSVDSIKKEGDIFKVVSGGAEYESKTVIIASGQSQSLGVPGEEEYLGKGVSYCATCDAPLYRGLDAAIIGGSGYAIEECIKLASFTKDTYIVNKAKDLNVPDELADAFNETKNIKVVNSTKVTKIYGDNSFVKGIKTTNLITDEAGDIKVDGVFIYLGKRPPSTKFLSDIVEKDDKGYLKADENLMTSVEGLFAIGDVRASSPHQVATAVGDAATCGIFIKKYLVTKH